MYQNTHLMNKHQNNFYYKYLWQIVAASKI